MRNSSNRIACLALALVAATATAAFACHDGSAANATNPKGKHHHKRNGAAGTAANFHQAPAPTQGTQNSAPNPAGVGALL
jgi:hypothetical protein